MAEPMSQSAENQIRGTGARQNIIRPDVSRLRDRLDQTFASRRRRCPQQPWQIFLQDCQDSGRRRKPGVQHIGVNDCLVAFKSLKLRSKGLEKSASMETGSRFAKRKIYLPDRLVLEPFKQPFEMSHMLAQSRRSDLQHIKSHRAGLEANPYRL